MQDRTGGPVRLWPPVGTATTQLPCGTCIGCRTDHATDWARRAVREAKSWENNCFITLTYDNTHLPYGGYLDPQALTDFVKRLRQGLHRRSPNILSSYDPAEWTAYRRAKRTAKEENKPLPPRPLSSSVRYLACGEYGEENQRPHYHALLFNCAFTDLIPAGADLYESKALAKLWKLGNHKIGTLTGASANYVAQYALKKQVSQRGVVADADGVVVPGPFLRMSLKPAIGQPWTRKYKGDLRNGYLVEDGRKGRIPRAIKKQLAAIDPQLAEQASHNASLHTRTKHNLRAAEIIHLGKAQTSQHRPL